MISGTGSVGSGLAISTSSKAICMASPYSTPTFLCDPSLGKKITEMPISCFSCFRPQINESGVIKYKPSDLSKGDLTEVCLDVLFSS